MKDRPIESTFGIGCMVKEGYTIGALSLQVVRAKGAKMPAVRGDGMRGLAVFISDIRNCELYD